VSFFTAEDFSTLVLTPALAVREVHCPDPDCEAVHGWQLSIGFLFWAVGVVFWKIPPGEAPQP